VYVEITHTWTADLEITLRSPAGNDVILSDNRGGSFDNVFNGTLFDDSSANPIQSYVFANNVVAPDLRPDQPLANFAVQCTDPNGVWELLITDSATADTGTLHRWDLILTANPECNRLQTLFTSNNGGSAGGQVFFDSHVTAPNGITVNEIETNTSAAAGTPVSIDVYTIPGTFVGSENNMAAWTLTSSGAGVSGGTDVPTLVDVTDFSLPAGTTGFALVMTSPTSHRYTNGTAANVFHSNSDLSFRLGKALNVPWTGSPFSPRVWNGAFNYCRNSPNDVCVLGGAGGVIPGAGAVDGTWPTILPTGAVVSPLAVDVPCGSFVSGVTLNGLSHTWAGDCFITLTDPLGIEHNLFQQVDGVFGGGCADDFGGNYTFVDVNGGGMTFACGTSPVPAGTYNQHFGAWPNGASNVYNTPLSKLPPISGTWTLNIYDWYVSADNGTLGSWDICFSTIPPGPVTYCPPRGPTAGGCLPQISATGNPDVAHSNTCIVDVTSLDGQRAGIIFYGLTANNLSWCAGGVGNSRLCVKSPLVRTPVQNTGGTLGGCDGSMSLDWNAFQLANPGALGNPWSAGSDAFLQGWFRSPMDCKTTFLSEALKLTHQP
jgi:subtilisin-like proprotein convertase family protein